MREWKGDKDWRKGGKAGKEKERKKIKKNRKTDSILHEKKQKKKQQLMNRKTNYNHCNYPYKLKQLKINKDQYFKVTGLARYSVTKNTLIKHL